MNVWNIMFHPSLCTIIVSHAESFAKEPTKLSYVLSHNNSHFRGTENRNEFVDMHVCFGERILETIWHKYKCDIGKSSARQ